MPFGTATGSRRFRHTSHAIPELIVRVGEVAPKAHKLEAKSVGGASVLAGFSGTGQRLGMNNAEAARQQLAEALGAGGQVQATSCNARLALRCRW